MMSEELKEIKDIVNDLLCLTICLEDYENGCGVDYSDVITDLKWTRMVLENRLRSLKGRLN